MHHFNGIRCVSKLLWRQMIWCNMFICKSDAIIFTHAASLCIRCIYTILHSSMLWVFTHMCTFLSNIRNLERKYKFTFVPYVICNLHFSNQISFCSGICVMNCYGTPQTNVVSSKWFWSNMCNNYINNIWSHSMW